MSANIEVKYLILTKIDCAEVIIIIVVKDVQLNKVSEIYYRQVLPQSTPISSLQWLYLYMASWTPLYYQISHRVRFGLMMILVKVYCKYVFIKFRTKIYFWYIW